MQFCLLLLNAQTYFFSANLLEDRNHLKRQLHMVEQEEIAPTIQTIAKILINILVENS